MALDIPEGSPNKTTTVASLMKIAAPADRVNRLRRLTRENLAIQLRVLRYNAAHHIHVFRFTSRLVPLATHPVAADWRYLEEFSLELAEIGAYVQERDMRVSAHPDHFTLLNSPSAEVLAASLADLEYHAGLFAAMGLGSQAKLVVHVGGLYKEKQKAISRFKTNYLALNPAIRQRLVGENDDKTYTAGDVLELCRTWPFPWCWIFTTTPAATGGKIWRKCCRQFLTPGGSSGLKSIFQVPKIRSILGHMPIISMLRNLFNSFL
jgi:UV DNA damage endonuclease